MADNSQNNKRIAKNAMMLYIRLFLIMGVNFYMSRVVLQILGVEDLGIYNLVGGIVTMMTFLNSSLNITTQRFMNYEMGKGRFENLNKIFSMSFWSVVLLRTLEYSRKQVGCCILGISVDYSHIHHQPAHCAIHFDYYRTREDELLRISVNRRCNPEACYSLRIKLH